MDERGNGMNVAQYEFNTPQLVILAVGDLHIGSEGSYYKQALNVVEKHQESKIIFMGDLIDNAIVDSLGDVYSQQENPQGALYIVRSIFQTYRDRILGVISGNHEYRTWKKVGIDPIKLVADAENIPYSQDLLVIDVSLKVEGKGRGTRQRTNYVIACHHGSAGGVFPEKAIRQHRYLTDMFSGADVYVTGHVHVPNIHKTAVFEYDAHNKKIYKRNVHHVTIPAWTQETYGIRKIYPPSADAIVEFELHAGREKFIKGSVI